MMAAKTVASTAENWVHKKAGQMDCQKAVRLAGQMVAHSAAQWVERTAVS